MSSSYRAVCFSPFSHYFNTFCLFICFVLCVFACACVCLLDVSVCLLDGLGCPELSVDGIGSFRAVDSGNCKLFNVGAGV